jgi:hypothetical protein
MTCTEQFQPPRRALGTFADLANFPHGSKSAFPEHLPITATFRAKES